MGWQTWADIIRAPRSYDGEHVDKPAALGANAAPAIGAVLLDGEEFPITLVWALERIEDERGMRPIVVFIGCQAPHSDGGRFLCT